MTEWTPELDRFVQRRVDRGEKHREVGGLIGVSAKAVERRLAKIRKPADHAPTKRVHVAHATDLHFGSSHHDSEALLEFLHAAWDRGCRRVACTGDVLDGIGDKFHFEQSHTGLDNQVAVAVGVIRKAPPMAWDMIGGNHDGYYFGKSGTDAGVVTQHAMRAAGVDWTYHGQCLANVIILGARWQLWHPHGNASTRNALRRLLNERAEAEVTRELTGEASPATRPHILAIGHFHRFVSLPIFPEHVHGIAGGTFQRKKSEFGQRITRPWDIGGTVVSYEIDATGAVRELAADFLRAKPTSPQG